MTGVPDASVVTAPPLEVDPRTAAAFDRVLREAVARGPAATIEEVPAPRHLFLRWLAEERGLLLHGSNDGGIEVFEPRPQTDAEQRPTRAVFAAADGLWPMFFAIVDRSRRHSLRNGFWRDGQGRRHYRFAVDAATLAGRHFVAGTVYALPPQGFTPCLTDDGGSTEEWLCPTAVVPVVRLPVEPVDFPFLGAVAAFDATGVFAVADALQVLEREAVAVREEADGVVFALRAPQLAAARDLLASLPELDLTGVTARLTRTGTDLAELRLAGAPAFLRTLRRWAALPA